MKKKPQKSNKNIKSSKVVKTAATKLQVALLQESLDKQAIENWDREEKINDLANQNKFLTAEMNIAKVSLLDALETQRVNLQNIKHSQQTIAELNTNFALAKQQLEKLKSTSVNEQQLAKKLVIISAENVDLKNQLQDVKQRFKTVYNCADPATPSEESSCGHCLACELSQTKYILSRTTENLRLLNIQLHESVGKDKFKLACELVKTLSEIREIEERALNQIIDSPFMFWTHPNIAFAAIHKAKVHYDMEPNITYDKKECDDNSGNNTQSVNCGNGSCGCDRTG